MVQLLYNNSRMASEETKNIMTEATTTTTKTTTPTTKPPAAAPTASTAAPTSSNKILAQCLTLLKGRSDEHKFAGLVMVTKHVPALTSGTTTAAFNSTDCDGSSGGAAGARGQGRDQLQQICDAVGTAFVHRLLKTAGDGGGGGGGGGEGLSVYQHIALGVLSAFVQDGALASTVCRCSDSRCARIWFLEWPRFRCTDTVWKRVNSVSGN